MQLQPHFLFNALNTIAEMAHDDPNSADRLIARLGHLLRLSLEQAGHQVVPFRQELQILEAYLEIEQARFQDRLETAIKARMGAHAAMAGPGFRVTWKRTKDVTTIDWQSVAVVTPSCQSDSESDRNVLPEPLSFVSSLLS